MENRILIEWHVTVISKRGLLHLDFLKHPLGVLKPVSFNKNKYWLQMEDLEKNTQIDFLIVH